MINETAPAFDQAEPQTQPPNSQALNTDKDTIEAFFESDSNWDMSPKRDSILVSTPVSKDNPARKSPTNTETSDKKKRREWRRLPKGTQQIEIEEESANKRRLSQNRKTSVNQQQSTPVGVKRSREETELRSGRKKAEREELPGCNCPSCVGFLEVAARDTGKSVAELQQLCSRHRYATGHAPHTPPKFWDIDFSPEPHPKPE
eukprot:c11340_g1_i2.p1 GENE.c11340_g1_i2~~c11340_g1_i2.p1  ORF type:complete len:203 (-),score=46.61 c11340_g1_i2:6-614(-)